VIVRVTRAKIQPNAEAEVFRILREVSTNSPRPPGMEAMPIGRRMRDGGNEFIAIGVWTDLEALRRR
jgi:heme-degrading monooxygenase HmoA